MAEITQEQLERLGIHVQGVPTEYTLSYGHISAVGPTLDLALMPFIAQLLEPIERIERIEQQIALLRETTDTAIKHLAGHVSHLALQLRVNQAESE